MPSPHDLGPEKADCTVVHDENAAGVNEAMAQSSDAEKCQILGVLYMASYIDRGNIGNAYTVALFLSFFDRRYEMGFRFGLFVSFAPMVDSISLHAY